MWNHRSATGSIHKNLKIHLQVIRFNSCRWSLSAQFPSPLCTDRLLLLLFLPPPPRLLFRSNRPERESAGPRASPPPNTKLTHMKYIFFLSTKQKKNYPWISLGSSLISRVVFDAFSLSHSSRNCLSAERGDYVFKGECREGGREREKGIVRNLCRLSRVMAVRNLRQSSVFFYDYFSFLRSPANSPRGPECLFFFVFHISTWNSTWR